MWVQFLAPLDGGVHPPVTSALAYPMHSVGLHMNCTHMHTTNTLTNKHNKKKIKPSQNNGKYDYKIYLNWQLYFKPWLYGYHLLLSLIFVRSLLQCDVSCADFTIYQQKYTFNGKYKHKVLTGIIKIEFYKILYELIASVLYIVILKIPAI